jgi:hypothetical protein
MRILETDLKGVNFQRDQCAVVLATGKCCLENSHSSHNLISQEFPSWRNLLRNWVEWKRVQNCCQDGVQRENGVLRERNKEDQKYQS